MSYVPKKCNYEYFILRQSIIKVFIMISLAITKLLFKCYSKDYLIYQIFHLN